MAAPLGLIGVGNLGLQFGLRAQQSFRLLAHDKDASRLSLLECEPHDSVSSLVRALKQQAERPTIVSIVPNDAVLKSISLDIIKAFDGPGLHISCSTVSPHTSRELAIDHAEVDVGFVAAPVFARPENMRDGQASFCVSGSSGVEDAATVLACAAPDERIFRFGSDPGAANVAKLTGNFMIGASMLVMAEGLALAEANHVDREATMDMLRSTIFNCAIFQSYGQRISRRDHRPGGFALEHGLKDASLILDTAHRAGQPLACASLLRDKFLAAKAQGHDDLDWSAVALQISRDAGRDIAPIVDRARAPPDADAPLPQ